ncbi:MAG: DivIVA domain-containing protein [Verrucomicrobiales bacterium]|jgi:DivIVA domain-containing protein
MAISPDDLRNKAFAIVKKGYDRPDVHRYLGAIADELEAFNRNALAEDEIILVNVEATSDNTPMIETRDRLDAPKLHEPEMTANVDGLNVDDFDRVRNEISLVLRQAQESSIKIRNDAEVEARTLVDQVRLDIESDRLAHEQAAGELISRTEDRAAVVRSEAEDYAIQSRNSADDYSEGRRETAERKASESEVAAKADRALAAHKLAAASEEAQATVIEANERAEQIISNAESEAQARSDQLLDEARTTLTTLVEAEKSSRDNLEDARKNIQAALEQLGVTEIDGAGTTA